MAQKSRKSRRSSGNKAAINKAREERRQASFAKKREEGRAYEYKPIPYAKDSNEYLDEKYNRSLKNVDHKTPFARFTSIMQKLDNELTKQKSERKGVKERKSNSRVKTA